MPRPALDLYAEVMTADGTRYRWDANQAPGSRLQSFSFSTKIGEGFSEGSGRLARRIDFNYPDVQLAQQVTVIGADGFVAYEGRLAAQPRELDDKHTVGITLSGYMAHAKDQKFQEIYVDRDLGAWGPASRARKITLLTANAKFFEPEQAIDPTDSAAGISTVMTDSWLSPFTPQCEAWYDAGAGLSIGLINYSWKREATTVDPVDTNWTWIVIASDDDKNTTSSGTAELRAAGPSALQGFAPPAGRRYASLLMKYFATPGGLDGSRYAIAWYKLAVYGRHGLSLYTGQPGEPEGVYASDVIKNIVGRWCPLLDTSGVEQTSYVIQHLTFKDRTYPYDAFLEVNKYHLWHLGVWENRKLCFRPYDFSDYKWEVRTDDPGTKIMLQGPSIETIFNGIVVSYMDVLTGTKNTLTPDGYSDLADTSPMNPWNQQGVRRWDELELSTPTLQAQALQIGRSALWERMRPKAPGTITVQGYIRDRAGNSQPVWKVRAGDMLVVSNYPNDIPRLIVETSYDDDSKTVTISVDRPMAVVEAALDRLTNAQAAASGAAQ